MTFPDNSTQQIAQIITQEYPSAKVFCDGRRVRLGYVSATVSPRGAIICTSGAAPEYASQGRTPADRFPALHRYPDQSSPAGLAAIPRLGVHAGGRLLRRDRTAR